MYGTPFLLTIPIFPEKSLNPVSVTVIISLKSSKIYSHPIFSISPSKRIAGIQLSYFFSLASEPVEGIVAKIVSAAITTKIISICFFIFFS